MSSARALAWNVGTCRPRVTAAAAADCCGLVGVERSVSSGDHREGLSTGCATLCCLAIRGFGWQLDAGFIERYRVDH